MTSTSRPHNATPQKLHLKPAQIPRMPFSSPMGEEVLSPTSDPSNTPPQQHTEKSTTSIGEQSPKHNRRKSLGERRSESQSAKNEVDTRRTDSPSRPKWTGLNVITDFKRGVDAMTSQTKSPPRAVKVAGSGLGTNHYNDRRNVADVVAGETRSDSRVGHKRSGRSLKGSGSKGRLDDLKRTSTKSSNLSPSDRAVVIGISVDPHDVSQNPSPGREHSLDSAQHEQDRRISLVPSLAPSIVVTPAQENAPRPWQEAGKTADSPPRRRPTSSIYSRMPGTDEAKASHIPPVPPLPARALPNDEHAKDLEHENRAPRIASNCTIFDEEPSPDALAQSRPASRESQLHMLDRTGTNDSTATKHRSDGWWNVLKSPFFAKSPMGLMFPQNNVGSPKQSLPQGKGASPLGRGRDSMSPGSPPRYRKSQVASAHTSWTDSSLAAECEKRALDFQDTQPRDKSVLQPPVSMPRESYYIAERFEGLGAASEYFHASNHDMYSSEPYFECQNHKCWPSTLGIGGYVARGTEGPPSPPLIAPPVSRGAVLDAGNPSETKGADSGLKPAPLQVPANRFSAAFGEAIDPPKDKDKHLSDVTIIDDEPTPIVREAKAAPIVKAPSPKPAMTPPVRKDSLARQPSTIHSSPFFNKPDPSPKALPNPPPRLPEKDANNADAARELDPETEPPRKPWVSGLPSNPRHKTLEQPMSPQPLTPGAQKQAPAGAVVLSEISHPREAGPGADQAPAHATYITNNYYHQHSKRGSQSSVTTADLWPPPRPQRPARPAEGLDSWSNSEKYPPPAKSKPESKAKILMDKLKACTQRKRKGTYVAARPTGEKKKRRLMIIIGIALLLLIITILVLAMTLTRRGDRMPAQSQWLNITGYPPVPTGISTIAQPDAAHEESGCVQPESMWSCALPKEQQAGIAPNAPNQPNFRVEIRFQNGTNATTGNSSSVTARSLKVSNAAGAKHYLHTKVLKLRDVFASNLYTPDPSPPSEEDQRFLGNSTDDNKAPFDGEYTPFFMTFHSSAAIPSRLFKRKVLDTDSGDDASSSNNDSFPDIASAIPDAQTNPDGTAAPAQLYPLPAAQPLRLFNRGQQNEHYGFYTYFSRSIFLKSVAPLNASIITGNEPPPDPADQDGGSTEQEASVRCTWAQTRFLVQIWTNKGAHPPLLSGNGSITTDSKHKNATAFSANNFQRPGSFPYPISITLDRHGGDIEKKMIYCYGLDNNAKPIPDAKKLQLEDRAFGAGDGGLVNPAKGPWKDVKVKTEDGGPGGIDGGSGGCGCTWQNWK